MRVFSAGIVTETNTFSPMPTGKADFDVIRAQELDSKGLRDNSAMDVFKKRSSEHSFDFIFSLYAFAQPAGLTVRKVYEDLRDEVLADLKQAGPVDIVLLPLHGAMVAEGYDDCEGDLIRHVREIVGPEVVIGVELDLHCHLSDDIVNYADLVVIFKEYPHTDIGDRAEDLFRLAVATAEKRIRPTMAMFDCQMIGMYLTPFEPMRSFVDEMMAAEGKDGILSLSLAHCFPWGDVADCGARMLAVTDDNVQQAQAVAEQWGRKFYALRKEVSLQPLSLEAAFDKALASDQYPVVIADQADNAGGGAPSDATFVLRYMLGRGITEAAIGMVWDPIVVQLATAAGVGARLQVRLGGKMGPMSGDPLDLEVTVTGVIEAMTQEWPQTSGALLMQCGAAVALHTSGIDIIVNSKRGQVFSPQVFSNFGIRPEEKKILVVKSTQHFYAGFAPIAAEILYMAAPGAVAPIMTDIPFVKADTNKYPWVQEPLAEG